MIIAPGFVLPARRQSPRDLWRSYDGSLDGVFQDISTYGGSPGDMGTVGTCVYDPVLNRGVAREDADIGLLQMFRVASPLVCERLGDQVLHSEGLFTGDIELTSSDERIWLPFINDTDSPSTARCRFAEYDANGLTQIGGQITDGISVSNNSNHRSIVSDLRDGTRAVWSFYEPTGLRVVILERSGGTLLTTPSSVLYGSGGTITDFEGARPLNQNRSIVTFPTNGSEPFTIQVQGCDHATTTPAQVGSASQITTNAASFAAVDGPYGRLSECLDGLGVTKGRFIFAWVDATNNDIQLRCIQYDASSDTIALGATLDTGISASRFELETLEAGVCVLIHTDGDPTASPGGFRIIEYDENDVDDLTLAMSPIGLRQVAKDGFLAGHSVSGLTQRAEAFRISRNRFGIAVGNSFDGAVNIKVVHNGGDSIV